MKDKGKFKKAWRQLGLIVMPALLLAALWSGTAGAVDRFWIGSAYYGHTWTTDSAWSPYGRPQAGDNVFISPVTPNTQKIVIGGDPSNDRTYTLLFLDSAYRGDYSAGWLYQDNTLLYTTVQTATVGSTGQGYWDNYTAINTINQELRLGYVAGGTGTYKLSQNIGLGLSGSLSSPYTFVGVSGRGYFVQDGGSNTSTNLHLGLNAGGSGSYELSGGSLTTANSYAGTYGTGSFKQSGGGHTATQNLFLATYSGSVGSYELSGGNLSTPVAYIGTTASGTFKQTGGINTVSQALLLGTNPGATGTYELSGSGSTLSAPNIYVGNQGSGTFKQSGGTATVSQVLYMGNYASGVGSYELSDGNLSTQDVRVGNVGQGTFTQSGGAQTVGQYLFIGNAAGSRGTYNLSGGSLSAPLSYVGNNSQGTFIHSGGAHNISDSLLVGNSVGVIGSYELSGTGSLSSPYQFIGNYGSGAFTQTGGTNTVTNALYLATATGSSGVYNLQGGSLSAATINLKSGGAFNLQGGALSFTTFNQQGGGITGTLENPASGTFNYSGGSFGGRLINRGAVNFNADFTAGDGLANYSGLTIGGGRTVTLNGQGLDNRQTLTLSGGTLGGSGAKANIGILSGYGTITGAGALNNSGTVTLSGGTSTVNSAVTNQAAGQVNISAPTTFGAAVSNYGTVRVTKTTVTFNSLYTEHGAYLSDPSINNFTDLTVSATGYLSGEAGDTWNISNDFVNQSVQNVSWNTGQAILKFVAGTDHAHNWYIPGQEKGGAYAGYNQNFAWGALNLTGETLTLYDGSGSDGGAQYLRKILGVEFNGLLVTNITGNGLLNLYYDPTQPENAYLGGLTYDLTGGGHLSPVPIPSTLLLLGSGLMGLAGWRRFREI